MTEPAVINSNSEIEPAVINSDSEITKTKLFGVDIDSKIFGGESQFMLLFKVSERVRSNHVAVVRDSEIHVANKRFRM